MKNHTGIFVSMPLINKKAVYSDCLFIFMLSTILKKKDNSDRDNR
jgi:hypothetical protein